MTERRPLSSQPLSSQPLSSLSDDQLLGRLAELLAASRHVEVDLVAHIGKVDARRLFRREAAASMFAYCTDVLRLSEHEAYLRITVARAAREHPRLLEMLSRGRLHLSGAAKLAPILTVANRDSVLERAACRSKREIEELVAEFAPQPPVPASIRKLPKRPSVLASQPATAAGILAPASVALSPSSTLPTSPPSVVVVDRSPAPERRSSIEALAPDRYKVQFTATRALRDQLERLTALMRTTVPDGDLAAILESVVSEKLQRLEARRLAKADRPRPAGVATTDGSRHVPASVRRAVQGRDQGRCRFVSMNGQRCRARERLEFHHVHPWAHGGPHSIANVRLMCRAHNALLAEHDFGQKRMARYRRVEATRGGKALEPP